MRENSYFLPFLVEKIKRNQCHTRVWFWLMTKDNFGGFTAIHVDRLKVASTVKAETLF